MILDWPACRNARDLGGLPTQDGGRIRGGALLRSDHHTGMTPESVAAVRAAGVSLLDHNKERVAAAFRAVAEAPPGGVLVHCHSGRDRTGVLVASGPTCAASASTSTTSTRSASACASPPSAPRPATAGMLTWWPAAAS